MIDPLAGVSTELFGSDSHVTAPSFLRMYLYSTLVLAGKLTVTGNNGSLAGDKNVH